MRKDLNKGISVIAYNSLNLPRQMDIKSPVAEARNEYTYSAGGQKLKVVEKWNPNYSKAPVVGSDITVSTLTQTTDSMGNKIYENGTLKRVLVDGGYIENGVYYFYLDDHLGNNRVVANASGIVTQKTHYYPFGTAFAESTSSDSQPYKYNGKELDKMHGLNLYDYSARYYESAIGRFTTIDPMAEKYYNWSPYVYVMNNPLKYIDPDGRMSMLGGQLKLLQMEAEANGQEIPDDYYSSRNGKLLGSDNSISDDMRLIDDDVYIESQNSSAINRDTQLFKKSKVIIIDNKKIQTDLQSVADNSSANGFEYQVYFVLDIKNAKITSLKGLTGSYNRSSIFTLPAPTIGVQYLWNRGGYIIVGQAHGHPATRLSGAITSKTMSEDFDLPTSANLQIPIYGIDAMDGPARGAPTWIHRVTPNGVIVNNVGKTSSNFNIGRQSMEIWGRR